MRARRTSPADPSTAGGLEVGGFVGFSVFGDAGVGLAYVSARIDLPASFGAAGFTDRTVNLMLRIATGAWYHATDRMKLGLVLQLDPILGDFGFRSRSGVSAGSQTTFLGQVGAQYRL